MNILRVIFLKSAFIIKSSCSLGLLILQMVMNMSSGSTTPSSAELFGFFRFPSSHPASGGGTFAGLALLGLSSKKIVFLKIMAHYTLQVHEHQRDRG
jgi:hypothetical protein